MNSTFRKKSIRLGYYDFVFLSHQPSHSQNTLTHTRRWPVAVAARFNLTLTTLCRLGSPRLMIRDRDRSRVSIKQTIKRSGREGGKGGGGRRRKERMHRRILGVRHFFSNDERTGKGVNSLSCRGVGSSAVSGKGVGPAIIYYLEIEFLLGTASVPRFN